MRRFHLAQRKDVVHFQRGLGAELLFGWGWSELIQLGRRGVREREEWISPLRFLGVLVRLSGSESRERDYELPGYISTTTIKTTERGD